MSRIVAVQRRSATGADPEAPLQHHAIRATTPPLGIMGQAERVGSGIEHNAPALTGLLGGLHGTEGFGEPHSSFHVVDGEVEVHLLPALLRGSSRRLVLLHALEGHQVALV